MRKPGLTLLHQLHTTALYAQKVYVDSNQIFPSLSYLFSRNRRQLNYFLVNLMISSAILMSHEVVGQTKVSSLGFTTDWWSDDTRNASGTDLLGTTNTAYGKPGQTNTYADAVAIGQQLQFVAGPANGLYGGAVKIIAPTGNSAKSTIAKVNLSGFAPASDLINGGFSANYKWYMEPNPTARTVAFRIGIQSTQWATSQSSFTAIRSGESTWDLILVHVMSSPVANAWNDVSVDLSNGLWYLYGQAGNGNWVSIAGSNPPGGGIQKTLADWQNDLTWGPVLFGAGSKVTNVQFGLGSGQQQCNVYVDYLQTSLLNGGNVIDFVCESGNTVKNTTTNTYYCSIQDAIDDANTLAGHSIVASAGIYNEDINVNKPVTLIGSGNAITTISGPIGGPTSTVGVNASGVVIDGFTITRDGNNVTDWNSSLNLAGISVQGQTNYAEVRNCKITGNRTGIDINNSNGNNIHNNIIDNNRTGLIFRNQTDNTTLNENFITNNWTLGVLFLDGSGGTNVPVQSAINSHFKNNNISGNWYGNVQDRQSGGSLALPGTNLKNFKCNWYGTPSLFTSNLNSNEPGYAAQIPVIFGGTAVPPPGIIPDILGTASANISFFPFSNNGTDDNNSIPGFQPVAGSCVVCFAGGSLVTNKTNNDVFCSIQTAIDAPETLTGDKLAVSQGTYSENVDAVASGKDLTFAPGSSPGCVTILGLTLNAGDALDIEINGTTPCTEYDQFIVNGAVDLGGANLVLTLGYMPAHGDQITIIDNDLIDPIIGQFAEGTSITVSGHTFIIDYSGGDGNDVVLTKCGPRLQTTINGVQVTDNGDGTNDTGSFSVCNSTSDNLNFTQFIDVTGSPVTPQVKVVQLFVLTNVTFGPGNGVAPLSAYSPAFNRNVSLVNPAVSGTLEMKFKIYFDDNNNNILDPGECMGDSVVYIVTIVPNPVADAPANVTECDSYTLQALTTGNYFTGSGGTGTALIAGDAITSSQTIYVFTETGTTPNCTDENSFTVTINNSPVVDSPSDVTACDSYVLPALSAGNYFTGSGGTGTSLTAGDDITSSQIIYVYAETGTTPNCTDENSFNITITKSPVLTTSLNNFTVTNINDGLTDEITISACNGLSGNIFISNDFADLAGAPNVRVYQTVLAGPNTIFSPWCNNCQAVIGIFTTGTSATATLIDPTLPGSVVVTYQAWGDDNNDGIIDAGECFGDLIQYNIIVNPAPQALVILDYDEVCAGQNLNASGNPSGGTLPYNHSWTGSGAAYLNDATIQNPIFNSQAGGSFDLEYTVTDDNGCSATSQATVLVHELPSISFDIAGNAVNSINNGITDPSELASVIVCDGGTYNIANLAHSNITNRYKVTVTPSGGVLLFDGSPAGNGDINAAQFNGAVGAHTITLANPTVGGSLMQVITPYNDVNNNGSLDGEDCAGDPITITYTAIPVPNIDVIADITVCDSYTLPTITGTNLSGNQAYYNDSQANGGTVVTGPITSSMMVWIYDETGTSPNCSDEESFVVTVNYTPVADAPSDVTACDAYTLPALSVGNYFTGSGGTGIPLFPGNNITTTQTIYVYTESGTTPNCTTENSFLVTINYTPDADAPSDVTACDVYTLPALSVGNYFTGSGGTGTLLFAGNIITSTQTIYVYAESGTTPNCTNQNSFLVTINYTPDADAPADVTTCDTYTLPALSVGNYFTGSGGTGTPLFAGNNITTTQTIYVYAETGTTPNCSDENSFVVTINYTPDADAPSEVTACDAYTLPALSVGNYFTGSGGTGIPLFAGNNITTTQTIYVYAESGTTPNCTDENSFVVTINYTPDADAPADVTSCDTYTLPALSVGNYFTGAGGSGTPLFAGNNITTTQTIYVYAETGTTPNCTDENSFLVTINYTPDADAPADVTSCDAYTLPVLTVGNYFTGSGGTGTPLFAGNVITSTQSIYVYSESGTTPNCTDEKSFLVTINYTPDADAPADVTSCDSYTLPVLTVGNYFTGVGGSGTPLFTGNNITTTQTIYVYAETGTTPNCTDENSFVVTIINSPILATSLNGVSVANVNDGLADEASFSVCDGLSDNIYISTDISDLAAVPNVRIYQTVAVGPNTYFSPWCNNCQALLGAFSTTNVATAALIDPTQPGSVIITFQAWRDDNGNSIPDIDECKGDTIRYTIIVNPTPQASVTPDDGEVCAGTDLNIDGNPAGGTSPYSHSWIGSGAVYLNNTSIQNPIFNSPIAGSFDLEYLVTDDNGCSTTSQTTVLVHEVPTFSFELSGIPASNNNNGITDASEVASVTICTGETYTVTNLVHSDPANRYFVTVTPAGGALLFDGIPTNNADISAAQFNGALGLHTISLVNPVVGGSLIQVITPYNDVNNNGSFDAGDCAGDPITITYTVTPEVLAIITTQPKNAYICEGQNATLSVIATGPGLYYQWQNLTGINTYTNITGANGPTYTINNVTVTGQKYRVIVYANYGLACQTEVESSTVTVIIGGNNGIVCNNLVQISLDESCTAVVTPAMILEGMYNHNFFTVQVLNANSQSLGNTINGTFINQTWTVKVFDNCNGNSCWGKIYVEDKLPPVIICRPDTIVNCYDNIDFTKAPYLPVAMDNCSGNVPVTVIYDVTSTPSCTGEFIATRVIKYRAIDFSNNVSKICERTIYYRRANINNIIFPKNYDGLAGNNAPLSCDYSWEIGVKNSYPDPHETGSPYFPGGSPLNSGNIDNSPCKILTTFSDEPINICPGTYKILRKWSVVDWCANLIRSEIQIIKVLDNEGPKATLPLASNVNVTACSPDPAIKVSAVIDSDPYLCSASWIASEPINITDCAGKANVTYTVRFLIADAFGNPPQNSQYAYQQGNTKSEKIISGPNAGKWLLTGLPIGCTWLRYTLTDPCGNTTDLYTEVRVIDKTLPIAVCDEFTIVTLTSTGSSRIYAKTFDNGSHDNCSAVTLEVRRMTPGCSQSTTAWGEFIEVCCDDVGKTIQVELKVTDSSGNSNICMVNVETKDKIFPILVCPGDLTLNCGADISPDATGKPKLAASGPGAYYYDNCSNPVLTWTDSGTLNSCGEGIIIRTYKVTDKSGNMRTCDQRITVRNTIPYNGPSWVNVGNKDVEGCIAVDTDPSKTGKPLFGNTNCAHIASAFEDKIFSNVDGVCYKIMRKWTVIDWCKFRVEGEPATYNWPSVPTEGINMWTYIQIIKVVDNTKPIISSTNTGKVFQVVSSTCGGPIQLIESATDCSDAATAALKWTYVVRRGSVNYKSGTGTGGALNASGTYDSGTYDITWTVSDQCGNTETRTYSFTIIDNKKPTPYCLGSISTVIMPSSGTVNVTARNFDRGSFDNCPGKLVFSFSGTYPVSFADSVRTFSCADFPVGKDTIHRSLNMYVWDQQKNGDFCTVTIVIQKNTACNTSGKPLTIGGNISTEANVMMNAVPVILSEEITADSKTILTDAKGEFAFHQMSETGSYLIKPEKNDNHLNGVSTLDLVIIQQHILDMRPFTSPFQYLAADANNDKKVTASDLVEIRKLILGQYDKFPKNTSWRFYTKGQSIPDPKFPWGLDETSQCVNKSGDQMDHKFIAVKTGDVNISATANASSPMTEKRRSTGILMVDDIRFVKQSIVFVPVTAHDIEQISGIQGAFGYDNKILEFKKIIPGAIPLLSENYNALAENSSVLFSWNTSYDAIQAEQQVLFTLEFESLGDGILSNALSLKSDRLNGEYYDNNKSENNLKLSFNIQNLEEQLILSQNSPNPFALSTNIPVSVPEDGLVQLKIYNTDGKLMLYKIEYFTKGKNEFIIHANDLNTSGMYIYEVKYKGKSISKKMLKISN